MNAVEELMERLAAIEARLVRLESGVAEVDRRTVGQIRLGPGRIDVARTEAVLKRQLAEIAETVKTSSHLTTDPADQRLGRGVDDTAREQNDVYLVLPADELAKGYVQPYRDSYRHSECGAVTAMGAAIAATYARDPWFYGSTYCCTCMKHRPLTEFTWPDGSPMSPTLWSDEVLQQVSERIKARDAEKETGGSA